MQTFAALELGIVESSDVSRSGLLSVLHTSSIAKASSPRRIVSKRIQPPARRRAGPIQTEGEGYEHSPSRQAQIRLDCRPASLAEVQWILMSTNPIVRLFALVEHGFSSSREP